MSALRPLLVLMFLGAASPLRAAGPPAPATPGAIRLGSDRLRIGNGGFVIAPDGAVLASGEVGGVCLWDLPSGRVGRRFEYAEYYQGVPHAFCPESRWLALTLDQYILDESGRKASFGLIDVQSGKRFSLLEIDDSLDFGGAAFLNRGRAVCYFERPSQDLAAELHVWALPSRKKLGRITDLTCFATAPGSDVLVTGHADGSVRFYEAGNLTRVASIRAHSAPVAHLALSPDGRLLASVGADEAATGERPRPRPNRVTVWNVSSRRCLRSLRDFGGPVSDLFFTTEKALCGIIDEERFSVYDARSGHAITPAHVEYNGIRRPAFSPDGSEVVSVGGDGSVVLRQVTRKEPLLILRGTPPTAFRAEFANGGRSIIVGGVQAVQHSPLVEKLGLGLGWVGMHCGVWDRATGAERDDPPWHRAKITQVAYSRDGRTVFSLDAAGELRLSALPGGKPHPSFSPKDAGRVMHFQLTPDGKQLCALTVDGRAEFRDIASGKRLRSVDLLGEALRGSLSKTLQPFWKTLHRSPLGVSLAIDRSCRVAVLRSSDEFLDVVRLESGKRTRIPFAAGRMSGPPATALSHDGRYLAASREYGFGLWDLPDGKRVVDRAYGGSELAFSPDGRYFAWSEGDGVGLFDTAKRALAGRLSSGDETFSPSTITFAADGKTLAASDGTRIFYWDLDTKTRRAEGFQRESAKALTPSPMIPLPSGAILSAETFRDEECTVRVRDPRTGMGLLPRMDLPEGEGDYATAVTPDGRVVAVGGRIVTLIDSATGKVIARLPRYHRGLISAIAFSPDGRTLTTGGTDAAVFVWDWRRFRE